MKPPVSVALISGFLGSGKTTLLRRILTESQGLKIGVIINEFGSIGIDSSLVSARTGDIIELNNGCVCCADRGDLVRSIKQLVDRKDLDHIVVEGSGLADPGPIVESLTSPELEDVMRFVGTTTIIDAKNFDANLEWAEAAYHQITSADNLLLNKADLVDEASLVLIEAGLASINPSAPVNRSIHADVPVSTVLAGPRFAGRISAAAPHRHEDFTSVNLQSSRPLDLGLVSRFLCGLDPTVLRAKGVIRSDAHGDPVDVVQLVSGQVMTEVSEHLTSADIDRSVLVIIGRSLDRQSLQEEFDRCEL